MPRKTLLLKIVMCSEWGKDYDKNSGGTNTWGEKHCTGMPTLPISLHHAPEIGRDRYSYQPSGFQHVARIKKNVTVITQPLNFSV